MATFRKARYSRFTIVPNSLINDDRLTLREVGLMTYLLSKPDWWEVRREALQEALGVGKKPLLAMFKVLREAGYLDYKKLSSGFAEYVVYDISKIPNGASDSEGEIPQNDPQSNQEGPDNFDKSSENRMITAKTEKDLWQKGASGSGGPTTARVSGEKWSEKPKAPKGSDIFNIESPNTEENTYSSMPPQMGALGLGEDGGSGRDGDLPVMSPPVEEVAEIYNRVCGRHLPKAMVGQWGASSRKRLRDRIAWVMRRPINKRDREGVSESAEVYAHSERALFHWWERFFTYVVQSEFLCGGKDWRCNLLWILKGDNIAKIAEGHYHRGGR